MSESHRESDFIENAQEFTSLDSIEDLCKQHAACHFGCHIQHSIITKSIYPLLPPLNSKGDVASCLLKDDKLPTKNVLGKRHVDEDGTCRQSSMPSTSIIGLSDPGQHSTGPVAGLIPREVI